MAAAKKAAAKAEPEKHEKREKVKDGPMESKPKAEPDRVAMPSLRADGKPDQSEGFKVIGEDEKPKD